MGNSDSMGNNEGGVIVLDRGSGVKRVVTGDAEVVYVEGETGHNNANVEEGNLYKSPIGSIETSETVVASNHVSGVCNVEAPKVGMVFKNWQDIEAYYKEYAEECGFGVTRPQGVYSTGVVRDRIATTWRCECWGRPDMRARREAKKRAKAMDVSGSGGVIGGVVGVDEMGQRKRKSKKCECKAMIYASVNRDGAWELKKVELEHNNHTPSPAMAKLVKEYRMKKFTSTVRKRLINFFDEGIPVSQIHGCLASERNGHENMPWTVKDLQHEVYKERRLRMVGGDCVAMMAYFQQMQTGNQNFYHAQRLDEEGRLKDVIWVDARSRVAYEDFGDVVCFDATYLTNEYDLPFVNFVGVNHHGQSILLGCALVSHEDCDTYKWIFKEWLSCMNNRAPKAILTDQAAAMRKPLEEVMPSTRHRWCIWHIMRKIPEKLGKCSRYNEFKNVMKGIVYESLTNEDFQSRWSAFIEEYELRSNEWLTYLYSERHMWVPSYMKDYFWAGMKTTQRVESINSFFDGFVNRHTKLFEFPHKYCKAMEKRVRDEIDADSNCSKYLRRLVTGFKVEKIFQKLYTDTKFQEVQTECSRMMYCYCRDETKLSDDEVKYVVEDRVWIVPEGRGEEQITDWRRYYSATFNKVTNEVLCDCRKFETDGIMCKHMMRILDQNLVFDLPSKYIVNRWRKDIPRRHTRVKVAYHDPSKTAEVIRYNTVMNEFEGLCDEAAMVNDETVEMVRDALAKLRADVRQRLVKKGEGSDPKTFPTPDGNGQSIYHDDGTASTVQNASLSKKIVADIGNDHQGNIIKDPSVTKRPRGRPKGSRNKSNAELGYVNNANKKRKKKAKGINQSSNVVRGVSKKQKQVGKWKAIDLDDDVDDNGDKDVDLEDVPDDDFLAGNVLEWSSDSSETF